jgi:hypothetical protein
MTGPRLFIIVAVLLVVLFAVSLAARTQTRERTTSAGAPAWLQAVKQKLVGDPKVATAEIKSACLVEDGPAFAFTGTAARVVCEVRIEPSAKPVRQMVLVPVAPAVFSIQFEPDPADDQAMPVNIRKVTADKPAKLVILKNGGKLTLTRISPASPARLTIE